MSDEETNTATTTESESKSGNTEQEKGPEGLTKEEITKLIEAARKQEKDKLYDRIEALNKEVTNLSSAAKQEREDKERVEREAKEKAERDRQSTLSDAEKLTESMRRIEEKLVKEQKAREQLEQEQVKLRQERDEERTLRELEVYKQELLKDEDEIIPDLVAGGTKEELENSVARARARFQEIFAATTNKAKGNAGRSMPSPTNPDPEAMEEEDMKGILPKDINPDSIAKGKVSKEYLKNREELLDRVAKAYQRQMGQ